MLNTMGLVVRLKLNFTQHSVMLYIEYLVLEIYKHCSVPINCFKTFGKINSKCRIKNVN